jgi:hypothetical protein
MAMGFQKQCDIGQGYNFKPDEHHTFGHINTLALGDSNIPSDIRVVDPAAVTSATGYPDSAGIFTYPVAAVLEDVAWSMLPNDNITLTARISPANASLLTTLATQPLKRVIVNLSFAVYQYDPVSQKYFTSFLSYKGVTSPKGGGFGNDGAAKPISALFAKTSATTFGLKVGAAQEDPLGIHNHTVELILAPPIVNTPQQLLIQTSDTLKMIQPWGIPK